MERESMTYDVLIVGAGPAGLSAAIKLKQLAQASNQDISVCLIEKAAQIGAHQLSGAVLEPKSLQALLPDSWQKAPLDTPVKDDRFYFLSKTKSFKLPTPSPMKNEGNYIISLGLLCQFLSEQAEQLGCDIFPGFAASEIVYDDQNQVIGIQTGDLGIDKQGNQTSNFQPGMHLLAKQTLFAEGCRGHLSQQLMAHYHLRKNCDPQTYAIGLKEIWQVPENQHERGLVVHTVGWPLDTSTYGGSFIYHLSNNRIALGFVIGLDYSNPWLDPFKTMQTFKTHPLVSKMLEGGERISYGARALNEGGWQSIPQLAFPGGSLIGCAAGFINVPKIKGIHMAIQSGQLAAQCCFDALEKADENTSVLHLKQLDDVIRQDWMGKELYQVRNIRPGFHRGLWLGLANAAFENYIAHGKSPWTLKNQDDHRQLKPVAVCKKIDYPKPDNKLTFDKLSSLALSNVYHDENQPCHLKLKDTAIPISLNYQTYASPETRYCPANVYEIVDDEGKPRLQINSPNCIHCKTCDIKDPSQNIQWVTPEGGGGPNYEAM
ncbi:electron transfer flavoprotein-ubiquinone oxidoreductase [Legionella sp. W05-934-2]|jgi:electron-transferring-flavoprotein dehydrogenase|uniref:electron transfer flavoprotein-ubiquinone oxidoreductase n=1 Tax=Legionella sp. W05-934-2 TaxID=1198649 RepID=UPI0034635AB9